MTITELIAALEKLKAEHGDLRVIQEGRDSTLDDVDPKHFTLEGWGVETHSIEETILL